MCVCMVPCYGALLWTSVPPRVNSLPRVPGIDSWIHRDLDQDNLPGLSLLDLVLWDAIKGKMGMILRALTKCLKGTL